MMINDEIWVPVVGYEGYYEISNLGGVRSLSRSSSAGRAVRHGRTLRTMIDSKGEGYVFVNLSKDGVVKKRNVHTMILEAFVGPRPGPDWQARHLDGCRSNSTLQNLRWGTPSENMRDKVAHGTHARGEKSAVAKLSNELVLWIRESTQSSLSLAPILGVASSTIRAVRTRTNWSYA